MSSRGQATGSGKHTYRPLLPAVPGTSTAASGASIPTGRKRGSLTTAACEECRRRKSKCTGERPECLPCERRGTVCRYDTEFSETHSHARRRKLSQLQIEKDEYEQLFDLMRTRSESEAEAILQRLRSGDEVTAILRQISDGDLLLQLALVPETKYRYRFPLVADMPPNLLVPENPYLASKIYEWTSGEASGSPERAGFPDAETTQRQSCYLHPFYASQFVDPLISSVTPSKWTSVSSNDSLMIEILHAYFLEEHAWWDFFPKDLFLADMAADRARFASSLLVNAVLALGCLCHHGFKNRAEFWNPQNLVYQFVAEARRLWELERGQMELTTIHAAMIIHLIYEMNGFDKLGWPYTVEAIAIARDLHLFEPCPDGDDGDMRAARLYTAWSLFAWQSHNCYHFFQPPLLDTPPEEPLPDPSATSNWYGELWYRYPLENELVAIHYGQLFKAKAELRTIMNDVTLHFRHSDVRPKATRQVVEGFYARLLSWYDALPEVLSPISIVWPAHLLLHLQYHHVIINLFEPFVASQRERLQISSLLSDSSSNDLRKIQQTSLICYETLIRIYYLRHGFDCLDVYLMHSLVMLGFIFLRKIAADGTLEAEERRFLQSTLLLAAIGLCRQGQSFFLARSLLRLIRDNAGPQEVELMKHFLRPHSLDETQPARLIQMQSTFPVNILDISEDPGRKSLDALMKRYEDIAIRSGSGTDTSGGPSREATDIQAMSDASSGTREP